MATYNVKKTAYHPANPFAINTLVLPDASDIGVPAWHFGGQQNIMSNGDSMLVQTQTGAMKRYKIDAERSRNGYIVLLPVDGQ